MKQRYYSLDVFRGTTVAFMILVNSPGSWSHLFSPLAHAKWHGLTPTDLVFPFFLFAVGNAMAFVMPRLEAEGPAVFWKKVLKRTALIFIGFFINWFPFVHWLNDELVIKGWTWKKADGEIAGVRTLGVLQRIALCYLFAAIIIYYAKQRGAFLIGLLLLLIYWALCIAGNPADPYSLNGWFGTGIDKQLIGEAHMYKGEGIPFDPEGFVSTLPAIVNVIFGFLVGDFIQKRVKTVAAAPENIASVNPLYQTLTILFIAAVALLFAGYAWNLSFPVNKKIWTSSYVVVTAGLAIIVLAVMIYFIEIKNACGKWSRFFDVFGKNPLFIYALSGLIPKTLSIFRIPNGTTDAGQVAYIGPWSWLYQNVFAKVLGPPELGSFLFALLFVLLL